MYAASSHPSTSLWPPPASHYAPQMPGMEGGQRGAGEWQPACSEVQSSSWKNWKRTGNFPARVHQSEGWARACSPTASHGFSIVSMRNKKTSSDAGQCVLFRFSFFVFFFVVVITQPPPPIPNPYSELHNVIPPSSYPPTLSLITSHTSLASSSGCHRLPCPCFSLITTWPDR